jgi:hypothetical protein
LVLALAPAGPASAWEVDAGASGPALEGFHDRFSLAAYPYPRHSAKPLGTLGFDVWVEGAATPDFEDEVRGAVIGDLPGGYLGIYRVGARKGLPLGIDVGASYGKVVDGDLELFSGEISWAILEGGVATPALGLRGTVTRSSGSDVYDLDQAGVELEISKGFTVLTPYAGAGLVWSDGTFDRVDGISGRRVELGFDSTRTVVYGGVILNLLVPKIAFEVSRGDELQGAVRISFGL